MVLLEFGHSGGVCPQAISAAAQPHLVDIVEFEESVEEVVAGRNFLAAAEILRIENISPPRFPRQLNNLTTSTLEPVFLRFKKPRWKKVFLAI